LLASRQEGLCLILSLLLAAISDSFRDMREQLNNSLLVNTDGKGSAFSTWVSFAEIYNENVYDLLEPIGLGRQKRQNLALGVDNKGQVYIKGKTFVSKILERFVAYCLHGLVTSNFFFFIL
jgi:kinesin family protein 20